MKHVVLFLAGLGTAALIAFGLTSTRGGRRIRQRVQQATTEITALDLNTCSFDALTGLDISRELAERIIENRPYRSKLELVERYIVPSEIYSIIRDRVKASGAHEPVKIAS